MKTTTNPNDYAFPNEGDDLGLTKREYFAALTMQGLMACPDVEGTPQVLAGRAVRFADALIDELNKE